MILRSSLFGCGIFSKRLYNNVELDFMETRVIVLKEYLDYFWLFFLWVDVF